MKMTKKLGLLASALICGACLTFTGCPDMWASFGKDDFFGTWKTMEFDTDGNPIQCYEAKNGNFYSITWKFDGTSENMFSGTGGTFTQHLVNYSSKDMTTVQNETFWYGEYAIKGNSAYSKGKLFLYYEVGFDIDDAVKAGVDGSCDETGKVYSLSKAGTSTSYNAEKAFNVLTTLYNWKVADFLNYAFDNTEGKANLGNEDLMAVAPLSYINADNGGAETKYTAITNCANGGYRKNFVTIQVRYKSAEKSSMVCSDIEYFRFNLKDPHNSGYTRMMATVLGTKKSKTDPDKTIGAVYNSWITSTDGLAIKSGETWKKTSYGYKVYDGCSWEPSKSSGATRYMARISIKTDADGNDVFLYSDTTPNKDYFNFVDTEDQTDYADADSEIKDTSSAEE